MLLSAQGFTHSSAQYFEHQKKNHLRGDWELDPSLGYHTQKSQQWKRQLKLSCPPTSYIKKKTFAQKPK